MEKEGKKLAFPNSEYNRDYDLRDLAHGKQRHKLKCNLDCDFEKNRSVNRALGLSHPEAVSLISKL